jgi:hypothetical protein
MCRSFYCSRTLLTSAEIEGILLDSADSILEIHMASGIDGSNSICEARGNIQVQRDGARLAVIIYTRRRGFELVER